MWIDAVLIEQCCNFIIAGCQCGQFVLLKNLVEVSTADDSTLPSLGHVSTEQLPECIASAASDEVELAARIMVWHHLNHSYRERYRQHRDAEEAATKAKWLAAHPDNRSWWDKLRKRILLAFERAELEEDHAARQRLLTFVVIGAGPTGVEMAGSIAELAHRALASDFRAIDPHLARVVLVEAGARALSSFPEELSAYTARELKKLNVELMTGTKVTGVDEAGVMLTSISIVRSSGAEDRVGAYWAQAFASQTQARHRLALSNATTSTILTVFPTLASTLVVVFVAVQGAYEVTSADYLMFTAALAQAIGAVAILASGLLPSLTVTETLRQASSVVEAPAEAASSGGLAPSLRGGITISGVSYRYGPDSPPVLHDVSIKIRPGEFVAFVGPSGAGKSSLLRLLLGFDTPEAGSILYDGVDIRSIDPEHLRSQLGVVLQSSRLIMGTIGENIRVGRPLTNDQVWEAAEAAGVAETLKSLPMGLNTPIVNDGSLSGGQRQRLVIARALAGNPAILVLDEATSALDNATQAHVTECINELGTTRIVIAHRLSTVRDADRIIVMERGRIVESGSPAELLRADGLFAALAARQLA